MSKLADEQILQIRKLRDQGMTFDKIGEMFGVTRHAISKIVRRKRWGHITSQ